MPRPSFRRILLAILLLGAALLSLQAISGCSSPSGYSGSVGGHMGVYYGTGYHDPWYHRPYYGRPYPPPAFRPPLPVRPPPGRPPRPVRPIRPQPR